MNQVGKVLILAPRGRDAQVIKEQVAAIGIDAASSSPVEIIAAVSSGDVDAVIVAEEALQSFDLSALGQAFADQPPWSDCPFLLLTRRDYHGLTGARMIKLVGNLTILECPLSVDALVSAVRSALRSRARQRRTQTYLLASVEAAAQVRQLATTLEARVTARTEELTRALAEQAESEELYRLTVELSGQIPWSADAAGAVLSFGTKLIERSGQPAAALLGTGWLLHVHPDEVDVVAASWQKAAAGSAPYEHVYRLRDATGDYVWYCSRAAASLTADGKVLRWYGTLEDIDERQTAAARLVAVQAELAEVSRTIAMGTMASTLAHELNQPLTAITNYVRGGRRMLQNDIARDEIVEALNQADKSAVRAGEIVRRARELVASGRVNRNPEAISALIGESENLALDMLRLSNIDRQIDLDPDVTSVDVDRVQIQQVLVNLIRNAAEAMSDTDTQKLVIATRRLPNNMCEITVRDTGSGIAPDVAARLFNPFNSTKSRGMGMGLSICRTIVEAHGGQIWSRPAHDGGTTFGFTVHCA